MPPPVPLVTAADAWFAAPPAPPTLVPLELVVLLLVATPLAVVLLPTATDESSSVPLIGTLVQAAAAKETPAQTDKKKGRRRWRIGRAEYGNMTDGGYTNHQSSPRDFPRRPATNPRVASFEDG